MNKIKEIKMKFNQPSKIIFSNGRIEESKCLNCKNKRCMFYKLEELSDDEINIPININKNVCPANAIDYKENHIVIKKDQCIKCGLCASRCINGSIYMGIDNYPVVNVGDAKLREIDFENAVKTGQIIDDDNTINEVYSKIIKNNIDANILSRNLLSQCNIRTILSRKGDVNLRMDSIIINNNKIGVCEIEFGNDVLSCPRCLLDDIAVMCSRYNYKMEELLALVICLGLPNNRTDFWRVIKDIKDVTEINIQTMSIGSLLLLVWNNIKVDLSNQLFYLDCENNSLKDRISISINKKVCINEDEYSALDTNK